ncbi:MAG TPA: hypothetical protein VH247_03785 [Thermoleophilaceae bacterium]|nr:hypothetical protein [Thermoleophilaceae bacterium]
MAWFGTRTYVGAQWTTMRAPDGSMTWTEITAANPFPGTATLGLSFRRANGVFDGRFFATRTLGGLTQANFLVRDLTLPNSFTGWFLLTSFPTPVVPAANIFWARNANDVAAIHVPIQQLAADGFPLGDAAAAPPPPAPPPAPAPIASISRPPATEQWAHAMFGDEHAQTVLELLKRAESAAQEGTELEPTTVVKGVLVDDEAEEFRRRFSEPPER